MAWRIKSGKFHTFPFDAHAVRQRFNSSNNGTLGCRFFCAAIWLFIHIPAGGPALSRRPAARRLAMPD